MSLIKPYYESFSQQAPTRQQDPVLGATDAASEVQAEDILFHIEEFVDSRWFGIGSGRVVKYRVRSVGYQPSDDTWQTIDESGWPASPAVLQRYRNFHDKYPGKVSDPRVIEAIGSD